MKLWKPTRAPYKGSPLVIQNWRIMKLIAIFMISGCLTAAANGFGQMVNISEKNISLEKVFRLIKKQTGYSFLYTETQLQNFKKISIDIKDAELEKALQVCFANQLFTYSIIEKTIIVKNITHTNAQQQELAVEITGRVTDANGNPLSGATVRVKGNEGGTSTAADGSFSLNVPKTEFVLVVSYVDYETKEIVVKDQSSLQIVLKKKESELNEVVVVGYGSQKKKDVTGSLATISSKDLDNRSNSQFGYSIEGKAAGVQVVRSSGQPQAGFSIRIRGTSSITAGSEPLYIIDGVPMEGINDINPSDIENITILKDASSAAIYGNRGANGVVLVTTKRGKNQKLKLGFNTSLTMSKPWKKMDVLNSTQFKELATEMGASTDWNKYNANTNWQDETFRNALSQNYQLSATGGNKSTSYYISGAVVNQKGIILNNSVKRATFKANVDQQITKFLKAGASFGYSNWNDRDVPENYRNGVIARLITTVPIIGLRDLDNPEMYARSPFLNDIENPVSTVYQPDHTYKSNRYSGNIYLEAEVIKGLKVKSLFGVEHMNGRYVAFQDTVQTRYGRTMHGLAWDNKYKFTNWISENTINYTTKIKNHSIAALAGFIVSRQLNDNLYKSSVNFTNAKNGDQSVEAGAVQAIPVKDINTISSVAFIGRLNYNYKDKYYLTTNFRRDGSGRFAPGNKWGSFPSFSAGWRVSEENFFHKNDRFISELKLRAGWGIVGNDAVPVNSRFGIVDTTSSKYLINNQIMSAYVPSSLENVDLTWEKTQQVDIGIDLGLFNNRLLITADYYNKKTTNMLLAVPIPTSTGYSIAWQNAGSLRNKGFEFSFNSKNIVHNNFKWSTDFNISFNRNKVLNIVGTQLVVGSINPAGSDYNTALVKEGGPLGSFYGKTSLGVDPATGNIRFLKTADASADSIGIIGYANPKFTFGFTNSIGWKNFSLDIFFQGVSGNKVMNATRILSESMALVMNQSSTVLNRWKNPGDITDMPGVSPNNWDNSYPSSRYIENGTYLRLKSLTLGYKLPETMINKIKMSRCFIYFTTENLLTFTKYSGFDPELSAFSAKSSSTTDKNAAPGIDWGTYPQSRDFILGINISF
ncbi:MAG: TonB-dependent receptor [Chitinophagaceae bacterium]|nr:TonB-dependent receptor [Chitinophagaceae bacterium]